MLSHEVGREPRTLRPTNMQAIWSAAAAISFAWFLYDGVARGWSSGTSDFPNYYTAAHLTANRVALPSFYDYPEFQRQIGLAGLDGQLGGYIPQTPLAALPFLPLSYLAPRDAKRAWVVLNIGLLGAALWLLSRITRFDIVHLWLLAFLGYGALRQNFRLGQYYVLLLALLTVAVYGLLRSRDTSAGAALATALCLKLYGAPFLLFVTARRKLRVSIVMLSISLAAITLAIGLFGWDGVVAYTSEILPRSLSGETLNPYHPANNTFVTLLRRLLVADAGLNPHPLVDSPVAFAFLQCALSLTILLLPTLSAWRRRGPVTKSELAWWSIVTLLVSPNTASYTFVLLLLPVALLLDELPRREWSYVLLPYILISLPVPGNWLSFFPKVWLLLFLFVRVGSRHLRNIRYSAATLALACLLVAGTTAALLAARFPETPAPNATLIASKPAAIYSGNPVVTKSGIFYQSISREHYAIELWQSGTFQTLFAEGHAFHPTAPESGARVYFERFAGTRSSIGFFDVLDHRYSLVPVDCPEPRTPVVSHDGRLLAVTSRGELHIYDGHSCRKIATWGSARYPAFTPGDTALVYIAKEAQKYRAMRFDFATSTNTVVFESQAELATPSISPDNSLLVYSSRNAGAWQIWVEELQSTRKFRITQGRCNSWSPAWSLDSRTLVFASDCKRGLNLPALWSISLDPALSPSGVPSSGY